MTRQRKLNNRELVTHLVSKGVTFKTVSQGQAITFLDKNNYYYKLASFRKNFKYGCQCRTFHKSRAVPSN